jgi:uroporphyrin-III C-methyltransferase
MGMSKLNEIAIFKRGRETPVAIIQNGTTPEEKIEMGTINSYSKSFLNKLSSPAIIVIGEVVEIEKRSIL